MVTDTPSLFERIDRGFVKTIKFISYASGVCLIAIMLIAFFDVVGQKLAKLGLPLVRGIPMASALIQYFHIPVVFLAAGYVTLDRGHTRIDMISCHFPKRVEKAIIAFGNFLGAAVSLFIAYRAFFVLLVRFYTSNSRISTSADAWPKWPFALVHGLGFLIMGLSFLWAIARQYWGPQDVNARGMSGNVVQGGETK